MKTAIIGLGNIGSRAASNLVAGGENVIIAARDLAKAQAFAKKVGSKVEAMSIEDALKKVDVLILGIWFETIKEFVAANRAARNAAITLFRTAKKPKHKRDLRHIYYRFWEWLTKCTA